MSQGYEVTSELPRRPASLGGRNSFLWRIELVKSPTQINRISVGGQSKIASHKKIKICRAEFPCSHSAAFTKISPRRFLFLFFTVVSVSHKDWPNYARSGLRPFITMSFFPIGIFLFPIEHFSAGDFRSACLRRPISLELWKCRRRVLKGLSTVFEKTVRPYER